MEMPNKQLEVWVGDDKRNLGRRDRFIGTLMVVEITAMDLTTRGTRGKVGQEQNLDD